MFTEQLFWRISQKLQAKPLTLMKEESLLVLFCEIWWNSFFTEHLQMRNSVTVKLQFPGLKNSIWFIWFILINHSRPLQDSFYWIGRRIQNHVKYLRRSNSMWDRSKLIFLNSLHTRSKIWRQSLEMLFSVIFILISWKCRGVWNVTNSVS